MTLTSTQAQVLLPIRHQREKDIEFWASSNVRPAEFWFCTWWFKRVNIPAANARRLLKLMEKTGYVVADHRQTNNTRWKITEAGLSALAKWEKENDGQ